MQTPIVASWAGGRADVFALSTSSPVMKHWWWSQGANALSGPEVVQAGTLMRGAVAVSWGPNRLDVLAIGDDHTLLHSAYPDPRQPGMGPFDPVSVQGALLSGAARLAAVCWGPQRIDVFAACLVGPEYIEGGSKRIYHWWCNGNVWCDRPEPLGSVFRGNGTPVAVSWAAGRLDVFTRVNDNRVQHLFYQENAIPWSEESLPWPWTSLDATSWGPQRIDLVGTLPPDPNGRTVLEHAWSTPGGFQSEPIGGAFAGGAAVARQAPADRWANRLDVVGADGASALRHWWSNNDTPSLQGPEAASPRAAWLQSAVCTSDPTNRWLFVTGSDRLSVASQPR